MKAHELAVFLQKEKSQLAKATQFISLFYNQIYSSLCNFRDNLFTSAFPSDQDWKLEINQKSREFIFPEINLRSIEGKLQNNSSFLYSILNNIHVMDNNILSRIEELTLQELEQIKKFNKWINDFLNLLFLKENTIVLTKQRLEIAKSIKTGILNNMQNNIITFWNQLQEILQDEYMLKFRPVLKPLIGSQKEYMADPFNFDRRIKHKVAELKLYYDHELILGIITELTKSNDNYYDEVQSKYNRPEENKTPKISYRLKEIASRYIGQFQNISNLENFILLIYDVFQPLSFFQRLLNSLKKMMTGKPIKIIKKDIQFNYSPEKGPINSKSYSIQKLLQEIKALKDFFSKFKRTFEFYKYTKISRFSKQKEFENIIDNSMTSLESIYTKSMGLKNWLSRKENAKYLKKISYKDQEDFNSVLMSINYNAIINKQAFRDYNKK